MKKFFIFILLTTCLSSWGAEDKFEVLLNGLPCSEGVVLIDGDSCVVRHTGIVDAGGVTWELRMMNTRGSKVWSTPLVTHADGSTGFKLLPDLLSGFSFDTYGDAVNYTNRDGDILQHGTVHVSGKGVTAEWPLVFMVLPSRITMEMTNVRPCEEKGENGRAIWLADFITWHRRASQSSLYKKSLTSSNDNPIGSIEGRNDVVLYSDMVIQLGDMFCCKAENGYGSVTAPWQLKFSDGTATAMESPSFPEGEIILQKGVETLYDLQGRRVTGKPKSGIYIKNGRKVFVR